MKTFRKFIVPLILAVLVSTNLVAEESASNSTASPWNFSATFDFVYYPKVNFVPGKTHFAPCTGAFDSIEMRLTANVSYTIPLSFGGTIEKIFGKSSLVFSQGLEITPITIMPKFKMSFSPLPFFVFDAGLNIGTGWPVNSKMMQIDGMALLDPSAVPNGSVSSFDAYYAIPAFKHFYIDPYVSATFQFDLAALPPFKSDWLHIVMLASYKTGYIALTGTKNQEVWKWQGGGNKTNGWQYEANFVL
ncbi:MAG: hypothetical protein IJR49_04525, partial [Treponema sp.]|nr:hypothetical protein [Treponema sp.]